MRRVASALAALTMAASLTSCGLLGGGGGGTKLTAYFPRAVSLYPSSSVKILGLTAGSVDDVKIDGTRVKVEMTISSDVPVPRDVEATLVPLSLIGERYVQLSPAWKEGEARAPSGTVIPIERTHIPVEPDEALAAVKKFLDTLDPEATGALVQNLADDLEGSGTSLNAALKGVAELTSTFAEKDVELVRIIDHFDDFTATLRTREGQLGRVMDDFATTTSLLAEERRNIENLVGSLADLSRIGFDLVSEHSTRLDRDITVLARVLQSVQTNIDNVVALLHSAPILVAGEDLDGEGEGLVAAYDPHFHHVDLRAVVSPTVATLFTSLGLPSLTVCLPVDVTCVPGPANPAGGAARAATNAAPAAPARPAAGPTTPVDSIVGLLGSSAIGESAAAGSAPVPAPRADRSGSWLARAARSLVEALS